PRRGTLGGQPCLPTVEDLPEPADIVFLATPRSAAIKTVDALRRVGAAGVVCYTAGFGELGEEGARLEQELVKTAGDVALVGPNCSGILNFVDNAPLWPFAYRNRPVERGVAFVTQSGMLGNTVTLNQRSVPFAYIISAGNQAMLGIEDYLDVLVEDPAVSAIALYVEGLSNIPRFTDAAVRALEHDVPIVVLKAGTSEIGAKLTVTHTGSLSGTDDLYQALFDRLGIVRVASPITLLETLKFLTVAGAPKGCRVAALTCSGGDSTMLADVGERMDISFPQPSADVAAALAAQLPPIATVSNPLDYTTPLWGHEEPLAGLFSTMFRDRYDAAIMVQDYPVSQSAECQEPYLADARAFISATYQAGLPAAVCTGLTETIDQEARDMLVAAGVAPLQGLEEALGAVSGASIYGQKRVQAISSGRLDDLRLAPAPVIGDDLATLDEWQGKQLIAEVGIPVPDGRRTDAGSAPDAAEELGFPVVVKMISTRLLHKTEAGAVMLGLENASQVAEAVSNIATAVAAGAGDAATNEYLVERMVENPVAELVVGVRNDPLFGPILVMGSGGTLVELVRDTQTLLLPTDQPTIYETLESLKISAMIDGFRGRPPGDREAVVDAIINLTRFADSYRPRLDELDINPLMVLEDGVVAVDVLVRMAVPE
ncbi:MAG: acetate--CoA ligase family protein, partial [Rhodospirillales bacterium]